jgi:hypothetical protein
VALPQKPPLEAVHLEHFGVPGMRWGYRKPEEVGPGRQSSGRAVAVPGATRAQRAPAAKRGLSSRNQKLVTAAAIAGTIAVGAILLSRGNVSVVNGSTARIAASGAKLSGKILGKTGKVLVKSSAKTAKIGAKVGFKTGKVGGKLAGKAAVGASKAAGRAAAQNGTDFYKNVMVPSGRGTTKVGSAAMFKLTGKGTPWVTSNVNKPMSLNPVNLLLNTRGDVRRKRR